MRSVLQLARPVNSRPEPEVTAPDSPDSGTSNMLADGHSDARGIPVAGSDLGMSTRPPHIDPSAGYEYGDSGTRLSPIGSVGSSPRDLRRKEST